jgi:hypothetical protein
VIGKKVRIGHCIFLNLTNSLNSNKVNYDVFDTIQTNKIQYDRI